MTRLLAGVLGALLLGLAAVAFALHNHGWRLLSVQTGSMAPVFWPGDALVVRPTGLPGLRTGDIVSYRNRLHPAEIITHRVVQVDRGHHKLATKGDALEFTDPIVDANQLTGQAVAVLPHLGAILQWLRRPVGLIIAIYAPAGLLIGRELVQLKRRYSRPYQLAASR